MINWKHLENPSLIKVTLSRAHTQTPYYNTATLVTNMSPILSAQMPTCKVKTNVRRFQKKKDEPGLDQWLMGITAAIPQA